MLVEQSTSLLIVSILLTAFFSLTTSTLIHSGQNVVTQVGNECRPLHSQANGLNLVCCNQTGGLSPDCQYKRYCSSKNCSCLLISMADFTCRPPQPNDRLVMWENHKPPTNEALPCVGLNFPNLQAEYSITIQKWSQNYSLFLIAALEKHRVTSLEIDLDSPLETIDLTGLDQFFPGLQRLTITSSPFQHAILIDSSFLNKFSQLKFLKIQNVDFKFHETRALWIQTLERLHIEDSTLNSLPRWFSQCSRLTNLLIRRTQIDSLLTISQMPFLALVYLDGNQFLDLEKISFASPYIEVIDLSANQITNFSIHTFLKLKNLRFLDLSKNKIRELPLRGFQSNGQLKYLHLEDLLIHEIVPESLAGLHTLKFLSLSKNPIHRLDPFAFLPIRMIKTLELNDCNLTSIPLAVTQCCLLTSLSVSGNLFYERGSLTTEVLALISHVDHLNFERNPIIQLPYGLFLLDRSKHQLMKSIVETLLTLPLWHNEPCAMFLWNIHLKDSHPDVKKRVSAWDANRMRIEKMTHCQQLYESIMSQLEMYRELNKNSGCESSRKLRSVKASCKTQLYSKSSLTNSKFAANCSKPTSLGVATNLTHQKRDPTKTITLVSIALNLFFITILFVRLLIKINSCQIKRDKEKFIRKSYRSEFKQAQMADPYDNTEETRNALLEAFELSRR